ncbi:class II aldolase/adducin family protein [Stetteria hydrogenophila]
MAEAWDPREQVAEVMQLLYRRGLVSILGGNASVIDRQRRLVYISPTAKPRTRVTPRDVAVIKLDGSVVEGRPSSEWRMHVEIYRRVAEARAVVHAHPPYTLLVSRLAPRGLAPRLGDAISVLAEAGVSAGGCIAEAPWAPPGTWELAERVAEALAGSGCRVAVMERHGVVAYSTESIYRALDAVEAVEDLARIVYAEALASRLG